ncbi:hypothetical protein IFR04_013171 [Cadophora malorum]|uniref:Uncharacterized protein n=1 Tax=Cadophora malorum TaxID=108018 RepID=A0A8H7T760_9HELO|nr:hypothetical protein IFR04_013171 [Cadophora malorum]
MAETPMRQTLMQALQMEDWIDRLGKPVGKVPYAALLGSDILKPDRCEMDGGVDEREPRRTIEHWQEDAPRCSRPMDPCYGAGTAEVRLNDKKVNFAEPGLKYSEYHAESIPSPTPSKKNISVQTVEK